MNWFIVAEHDLSKNNATGTHVLELCSALAKKIPVTLVSFSTNLNLHSANTFQAISIEPYRFRPKNLAIFINSFRVAILLIKLRDKIEVLYIRASALSIGPIIFSKLFRVLSILEINGIWSDEQNLSAPKNNYLSRMITNLIQGIRNFSLNFMCKYATKIVVVTPGIGDFLAENGFSRSKIFLVKNGANTDKFIPRDKSISKLDVGLKAKYEYVGYVGSLSPWQGLEVLLDAFASKMIANNVKLLLVGNGSMYRTLLDQTRKLGITHKVIFIGETVYSNIPTYISACKVLVAPKLYLPSGYSPLKVYEYLSCGRPIIASRVNGLKFIEEQGVGLNFPAGNSDKLAACIERILSLNEAEWLSMGNNARNLALENFSWDKSAQKIIDSVK